MSECDDEVCWPSVEHIQPEQCEKNAAILFVSIEPLHCGSVNRGEVSGRVIWQKKKSFISEDKKQDKVPVGVKNGFDLTAQCKCHMTPFTCKPVYYIGHNIIITLRRIAPEKTRRPVFIDSRHVDIVRSVFLWFLNVYSWFGIIQQRSMSLASSVVFIIYNKSGTRRRNPSSVRKHTDVHILSNVSGFITC